MGRLEDVIAEALGIRADQVADDLCYESIPEWDSMNHVNLMLALEERFGLEIDESLMVALTSVRAIRDFVKES